MREQALKACPEAELKSNGQEKQLEEYTVSHMFTLR